MVDEFPKSDLLLVNKPTGVTSHDVVNWVRRKSGVKRVGHAGTLDPLATGLLIILITREWTKRQSEFLKLDKEYWTEGQLGVVSDTYDIDGQVSPVKDARLVNRAEMEVALSSFVSQVEQVVPPYSAVKKRGKKLYQLARSGKLSAEDLPTRLVEIRDLKLLEFNQPKQTFLLSVHCSSGTYIRSLVHDLGQQLSCGAVVKALWRTKIGQYDVKDALTCDL